VCILYNKCSGVWIIISALRTLRQENSEFEASLGYKNLTQSKQRKKERNVLSLTLSLSLSLFLSFFLMVFVCKRIEKDIP
jgi:hypothetical protein